MRLIPRQKKTTDIETRLSFTDLLEQGVYVFPHPDSAVYEYYGDKEIGPCDVRDLDDPAGYIDELNNSDPKPYMPKHSLHPWLDIPTHVWTKNVFFFSPLISQIQGLGYDIDDDTQRVCESLVLTCPAYGGRDDCTLVLSVLAAPRSGKLWAETGWQDAFSKMSADGVKVTASRSPWGVDVTAKARQQQVYVCGVDGSGWMVKAVVYGEKITHKNIEMTHEVIRSMIIHRGSDPMGPGTPIDMSLLDRRKKIQKNLERHSTSEFPKNRDVFNTSRQESRDGKAIDIEPF